MNPFEYKEKVMIIDQLIEAINKKSPISFQYNKLGKTPGIRVGNPHAIFIMRKKDGSESTKVHIFQTGGISDSSQLLPDFRLFDLDEISGITVHSDMAPFEISQKYNPEWEGYKFIVAKV